MNKSDSLVVIGIDPGLTATGYAVVRREKNKVCLVDVGCLKPKRNWKLCDKLFYLYNELIVILNRYTPKEAAIEDVFVAKNARSALKLGHARGSIMVACSVSKVKIFTYEPVIIKKSVVGTGAADKAQVKFMVGKIVDVDPDWPEDASDALAAAICHLNHRTFYDRLY